MNILFSIDVIDGGIAMLERVEQPQNALSLILVNELGKLITERLLQSAKAE